MMRRAQPWLGTLVDISVDQPADGEAITAAYAVIAQVHRLMSFHDAASDVSRFNRAAAGELIEVDQHTWTVLELAQQLGLASQGCFDIACAPRLVEWGFLPAPAAPSPAYLPAAAVYRLEPGRRVRKTSAGWIDLGGIAKGYAVDLAIEALGRYGVTRACVNAGGDLRVIGPDAWPVAIRAPDQPAAAGARVDLRNAALATSAIYFSADKPGLSPLVDGRDGAALLSGVSVTVIAPRCAVADALTKVVMASGDARHPSLARFGGDAFII